MCLVYHRVAVFFCGGGVHQATFQKQAGWHGAQRLPVPEETGSAAHEAH